MSDIIRINKDIEEHKELVTQRDLALRLFGNHDFKKLIIDGFCKDECARFAQASGDHLLSENQRKDCLGAAQGAGYLRRWLSNIVQMGNQSEQIIPDLEAELAAIRQENPEEAEDND